MGSNCGFGNVCSQGVHFGLGEINNFIENIEVFIHSTNYQEGTWTPIIPNSVVEMLLVDYKTLYWVP